LGPEECHAATIWLVAALHRALLRLCQIPMVYGNGADPCLGSPVVGAHMAHFRSDTEA